MYAIYPWQQQEWQQLLNRKKNQNMPHAILIRGMAGVGKYHFALGIAELLLCQNVTTAGTHPDLIIIKPEDKSRVIKIDQIREVIADLNNTSQQGGYKVVIIDQAELLNIAASNSILKTLEEPADNAIIILTTNNSAALAATIRSRCQTITIRTPSFAEGCAWLKQQSSDANLTLALALAENAPLKALDILCEDNLNKRNEFFQCLYALHNNQISSVKAAEQYLVWDLKSLLPIFMQVISDIIKIKFSSFGNIINQDQIDGLKQIASKTNLLKLFGYQKQLYQLQQSLTKNLNLNQQLALENLTISLAQLFNPSK